LVQLVITERGLNPHTTVVLTGMDDGQGFCKVGALFLDKTSDATKTGRSKYSEVKETIKVR
jgi:hypothetical protein